MLPRECGDGSHTYQYVFPAANVLYPIQLSLSGKGNEILFRLFDHDKLSKDDPMGEALLSIPNPLVSSSPLSNSTFRSSLDCTNSLVVVVVG